ncbi:hypothetical protein GCM10010465_02580 [Actinomadura fibrosa]
MLLFFLKSYSQKETVEVLEAGRLERLVLDSDEVFKISINTVPGHIIKITSRSDGEYYNDIRLETEEVEKTLFLRSQYREILQSGFDKLSAHKVFAMELELEIPEDFVVEVKSNVATVFLNGKYEQVLVQLKSGSCFLNNFKGDAVVNTFEGNITVETENALIDADSRHGKVNLPHGSRGTKRISLHSINGNIEVTETK